jgi:uncharacterized phosphosugar-binding protein
MTTESERKNNPTPSGSSSIEPLSLTFPNQLDRVRDTMLHQVDALRSAASLYAGAIAAGGVIHAYGNGHSRLAIEEMCVRIGALTGFHPILQVGLTSFTDVVGPSGIRLNQALEKFEGLGDQLLQEFDVAAGEPLVVVSATGQTTVAVDIALAWTQRYPDNPLIAICSREQARTGVPKHSSGKTLFHVVHESKHGLLLDNGMPVGDSSVTVAGKTGSYPVCPLSSLGALSVVQCLNELTIRELDRRGIKHHVLRNMHLSDTRESYNAWIRDQRQRYAKSLHADRS